MKNKLLRVLCIAFVIAAVALALAACGSNEQSLDGMYIVTFELNGGVLDTGSTNATGKIYHAYSPDPEKPAVKVIKIHEKFPLTREGYVFDGWYTDEQLKKEFSFDTALTGNITLYAKWKSAIVYSYTVYVQGIADPVGRYEVDAGDKFNDSNRFGTSLALYDKTFLGYYSDRELTHEWDNSFTHPGGETSKDIPVYVKAMEGVWTFVSNYEELSAAIKAKANIWLTDNINCGGEELFFGDVQTRFAQKINGNKKTISNFTIAQMGGNDPRKQAYSLFGAIQSEASIVDVNFENALFDIKPKYENIEVTEVKAAALAISAEEGAEIKNVHIGGTYINGTSVELNKINQPFYEEANAVSISDFVANITEQND